MTAVDRGVTTPLRAPLMRVGSVAAAVVTAATVAWVALLAAGPTLADGADAQQRIDFLTEHMGWHLAGFAVVAPLALLYVPMWLGLAALLWPRQPAAGLLAVAFGLVYTPFGLFGYWSQLTIVRGLTQLHTTSPNEALVAVEVLAFDGQPWSIGYATAVLAYTVWGVAAIAAAIGLLRDRQALARWTGGFFALTGLLSLLGAVGFVARVELLEFGVMISGVTSLLASAATAVLLHRRARTDGVSR